MHLARKVTMLLAAVALPLSLAACAPDQAEEAVEQAGEAAGEAVTPAPAPTGIEPMTVQFTPLNNATSTGSIEVDDEGEQTRITANIAGGQANGVHQGFVHSGTCDAIGAVVQPLQPITAGADGSGQAVSTVPIAPATAMNGQHIVVYHAAGGNPGNAIACAAIPAHTM